MEGFDQMANKGNVPLTRENKTNHGTRVGGNPYSSLKEVSYMSYDLCQNQKEGRRRWNGRKACRTGISRPAERSYGAWKTSGRLLYGSVRPPALPFKIKTARSTAERR